MTDELRRLKVRDYWGQRDLLLAWSGQDKGLIAIGEPLPEGGERWMHLRVEDVQRIVEMSLPETADSEDVEIEIHGWKGRDELAIIEADGEYIVKEHRKVKEDGSVEELQHVIPKRNVHILWSIIRSNTDKETTYQYRWLVRKVCEHYKFHETEGIPLAQMMDAFNGGRHRATKYFKFLYYPLKVLESEGLIQYYGRGGVKRLGD